MVSTFKPVIVVWCVYLTLSALADPDQKRTKRIINGRPLYSHDEYNTHFFVEIVHTGNCASDQFNHVLNDCTHTHVCGGAIIREDFVLTACHCTVYEDWYAWPFNAQPLPPIPTIHYDEVPSWVDDRLVHKPLEYAKVVIGRVRTNHPLLNPMTLRAGSPLRERSPQKRHAAAFFPHHLCAERLVYVNQSFAGKSFYEMDIGLIKPCIPFVVNKEVQLAPLQTISVMEQQFELIVKQSRVCLYAGWGYSLKEGSPMFPVKDQIRVFPDYLQHTFRYMECHNECTRHICRVCSLHFGSNITHPASGDSGSPIMCDGYDVAVHSGSAEFYEKNLTSSTDVVIACVKDYITGQHLDYLRSTHDEVFHWMDGHPVTAKSFYRHRFRALAQRTGLLPSLASRHHCSLIFAMLPTVFILWKQRLLQLLYW